MAKTTRVVLTCDLHGDGTEAVSSVTITDGRTRYELDLCQEHLDELKAAARRVRRSGRGRKAATTRPRAAKKASARKGTRAGGRRASAADTAALREWARSNGLTISDRGRIPDSVREAYRAAH